MSRIVEFVKRKIRDHSPKLNPEPASYLRVTCSVLALASFGNALLAFMGSSPTLDEAIISVGSLLAFLLLWVKLSILSRRGWVLLDGSLYFVGTVWVLQIIETWTEAGIDDFSRARSIAFATAFAILAFSTARIERMFIKDIVKVRPAITDIPAEYTTSGEHITVAESSIPAFFRRRFVVSSAGLSLILVSLLSAQYDAVTDFTLIRSWSFAGVITGIICLLAPFSTARWPTIWGGSLMVTLAAIRSIGYFILSGETDISDTVRAERLNSTILWAFFGLMTAAFWFWVVLREVPLDRGRRHPNE